MAQCKGFLCYYPPIAHRLSLQSDAIKGKINLTCNVWQAENTDGYFVVTGHWVEEGSQGSDMWMEWKVKLSLFGFVHMNCSHDGWQLGHALFKIVAHLKVKHKVCSFNAYLIPVSLWNVHAQIGYITCDNTTNNNTMASYFTSHVAGTTELKHLGKGCHVQCVLTVYSLGSCMITKTLHRCLKHIINLVTQAFIKVYSKS